MSFDLVVGQREPARDFLTSHAMNIAKDQAGSMHGLEGLAVAQPASEGRFPCPLARRQALEVSLLNVRTAPVVGGLVLRDREEPCGQLGGIDDRHVRYSARNTSLAMSSATSRRPTHLRA